MAKTLVEEEFQCVWRRELGWPRGSFSLPPSSFPPFLLSTHHSFLNSHSLWAPAVFKTLSNPGCQRREGNLDISDKLTCLILDGGVIYESASTVP